MPAMDHAGARPSPRTYGPEVFTPVRKGACRGRRRIGRCATPCQGGSIQPEVGLLFLDAASCGAASRFARSTGLAAKGFAVSSVRKPMIAGGHNKLLTPLFGRVGCGLRRQNVLTSDAGAAAEYCNPPQMPCEGRKEKLKSASCSIRPCVPLAPICGTTKHHLG